MFGSKLFWMVQAGIFAGIACIPFITHWIMLVYTALGKHPGMDPTLHGSRRIGPMLFAVLHPTPWLLFVGAPLGIHRLVTSPPAVEWIWFFVTAAASLMSVVALSVFLAFQHRRKAAGAALHDSSDKGVA